MYTGLMSRGTIVCGKFVSSGAAIALLITGKVFLVFGICLFCVEVSGCSHYYDDACSYFIISASIAVGLGVVLIFPGAIIYYMIRKNPVRNPAAPVYNHPPSSSIPPSPPGAYPGTVYQYPAPGIYPGQPTAAYPGQTVAIYQGQPATIYPGNPDPGQPVPTQFGQPVTAYPGQPS